MRGTAPNSDAIRGTVETLHLTINGPGGDWHTTKQILAAIEKARQRGMRVHIYGEGEVSSAAVVLLSVGDRGHRTIHPLTTGLLHDGSVNRKTMVWSLGILDIGDYTRLLPSTNSQVSHN